jgi:hypothetical protein
MDVEMVAKNIQLIIAPVVMISSCAILLGGLLGRYAAVNDRLRAMARERLELWHTGTDSDSFRTERLQEIDRQIPDLLGRHRLIHHSVLSVFSAILVFVLSMFALAFGASMQAAWIAMTVLVMFLLGLAALLLGIGLAAMEVRSSHLAVRYEVERVASLGQQPAPGATRMAGTHI